VKFVLGIGGTDVQQLLFPICERHGATCAGSSSQQPPGPPNGPPRGPGGGNDGNGNIKNYLIAGAFFIGIGTGVWFDSSASFTPNNVASTEIVDRKTPNSEICIASGYSSMVFDQRLFVSFNP